MGQDQGCTVHILGPQHAATGLFEQRGLQYGGRDCHPTQHLVRVVLGIYFEPLASTCHASHCNMHCLSSYSFPHNMHWSLTIPEKCEHHLSCCWLRFDRGHLVFLFHTLAFVLWIMMFHILFPVTKQHSKASLSS
jgi:hypothetical protein